MDKVRHKWMITVALTVWAATWATDSLAGTIMIPPPSRGTASWEDQRYPESRFGKPTPKITTGTESGYAANQVDDVDAGYERAQDTRRPASVRVLNETPERSHGEEAMIRRTGVQEHALIANDLGYFPQTIFVTRDVPVRLFVTGASKHSLCIMMDSFQVKKQIRANRVEEIAFTPNVPGKYRFYCPVNGMEGTLVVRELSTSRAVASEE